MNIEKIKSANTKYLGKNIIYYEKINSTQDEAKRIIHDNISNGTIIMADEQTKGKGTHGRKWHTGAENNIAMSIIIYPKCNIKNVEGLTIKIAESMCNAIKELYGYELKIKFPNDIILNNKKIGGILTECNTLDEIVQHIIIGFGFNVNEINFSEETKEIATSLKKEYKKDFSKEDIIIKFLEIFEKIIEDML